MDLEKSVTRPGIIRTLDPFLLEHLRNIILDRGDDGTVRLVAGCSLCRDLMEWASYGE